MYELDGIGFIVSLQGACFGGTSYVRKKLKAVVSGVPRSVKVRLVSSDARSLYDEEELEGFKPAKHSKRIGHLGIHMDDDYVPADDIKFSSLDTGCTLDLGRYGPFRKSGEYSYHSLVFGDSPCLFLTPVVLFFCRP